MPLRGRPRNPHLESTPRFHRGGVLSVNLHGEQPDRFQNPPNLVVPRRGQSPGTMDTTDTRRDTQAGGTIRRLWRQAVGMIPAPPPFEWSKQPATITRALRYRVSTAHLMAGSSNTRYGAPRAVLAKTPGSRGPRVTIGAGQKQSRPNVRNRLTSFGSRVPTTNDVSPAAEVPQQ